MANPPHLFRRFVSRTSRVAMGALVAGTAIGGRLATPVFAQSPVSPLLAASASSTSGEQGARAFDLPAGPLAEALQAFAAATGLRVNADATLIAPFTSPGVKGMFTVERALARLLEGTSLRFRFTAPDTVALDLQLTEFVAVEGDGAPARRPEVHRAAARHPADDHRDSRRR